MTRFNRATEGCDDQNDDEQLFCLSLEKQLKSLASQFTSCAKTRDQQNN